VVQPQPSDCDHDVVLLYINYYESEKYLTSFYSGVDLEISNGDLHFLSEKIH